MAAEAGGHDPQPSGYDCVSVYTIRLGETWHRSTTAQDFVGVMSAVPLALLSYYMNIDIYI